MNTAQPSLWLVEGADAAAQCRAYVARELTGLPDGIVADAQLVATELVTNAQLHGEPPVLMGVTRLGDDAVRVEVSDSGRGRLVLPASGPDAMTGRGLTVVAAVAESWGVELTADEGKVVWVVIRPGSSERLEQPEIDLDALLAAWEPEGDEAEFTVRLGRVPTSLLIDAEQHIDNVVRELTLLGASAAAPAGLAQLVGVITVEFARVRAELKEQAAAAAARGERYTDLALTLPGSAVDAGHRYLSALDEVDRYARSARILTLETPPLHRLFRRWYVNSLVDEVQARAAGREPDEPVSFVEVLAHEVEELSSLRETAFRLDLLQRMNAALADAHTAEDLAYTVISAAVRELGAVTARVYVNTGDRLTAFGQRAAPDAGVSNYDEVPLDAEIPSAIVFRTGRPIVVRSVTQLRNQFPELADIFDSERALHVVPIQLGRRRLGVLGLAFPPTSKYDEAAQTRFMRALADVLAQGLVRIEQPPAPPPLPPVPGLDVGAVFEPFAGAIGLAGDFYDLFPLGPDRWMLAIGDVVGKGADAAAATGLVRHTLWGAAQHAPTPAAVAHAINGALLRQGAERFATLVLAVLTSGADGLGVDAIWAGHPPGLLLRDGSVDLVHGSGFPVGMFGDVEFSPVRFTVRPGETLMLYTDGLLERRGALLDEQALTERLLAHEQRPAQDLVRAVVSDIGDRYPARDDVAALALRPL